MSAESRGNLVLWPPNPCLRAKYFEIYQYISKYPFKIFQIFQQIQNIFTVILSQPFSLRQHLCKCARYFRTHFPCFQNQDSKVFCLFLGSGCAEEKFLIFDINFNSTTELPSGFRTHSSSQTILPGN